MSLATRIRRQTAEPPPVPTATPALHEPPGLQRMLPLADMPAWTEPVARRRRKPAPVPADHSSWMADDLARPIDLPPVSPDAVYDDLDVPDLEPQARYYRAVVVDMRNRIIDTLRIAENSPAPLEVTADLVCHVLRVNDRTLAAWRARREEGR